MGKPRPNVVENLGGVRSFKKGPLAERPDVGQPGEFFFSTDVGRLSEGNGSGWATRAVSRWEDLQNKPTGIIICTSTTRPPGGANGPVEGQHIYETDTDATLKNTGTPASPVWSALGGGGSGGAHAATHYWNGSDPIDAMEIGALTATAPSINLQPDSGRFAGAINPLQQVASTFTGSGFWSSINGATIASGGRFIQDNTSFGGTGGALTQDVIDLLAAMGRSGTGARYGIEFFVQSVTAGTGTAEPWNDDATLVRYPVMQNGNRAIYGMGNTVSMAFWVRLKSVAVAGRTALIPFKPYLAINGVAVPAGYKVLTLANGWTHVALYGSSAIGYNTTFPAISANSGDVVQIALPVVVPGKVRLPVHTAPVPTINGASA